MNRVVAFCLSAVLALAASGCVIIDGERVDIDEWRDSTRDNRKAISELDIGTSRTAVVELLGAPADSEAFTRDGDEVRVLFYRIDPRKSGGDTIRDQTTPLIFRNDILVGWGDTVYNTVR